MVMLNDKNSQPCIQIPLLSFNMSLQQGRVTRITEMRIQFYLLELI